MKSEKLVDYTLQLWNDRELDLVEDMYLPNVYVHTPDSEEVMYFDEHKQWIQTFFDAYPDFQVEFHEMTVGEFLIFCRWTMSGTQEGSLGALPPTGKKVEIEGVTIYRLEEDRIAEAWWYYDRLDVMQQLGFIPKEFAFEPA